jgi:hypothetical protein
MWNPNSTRHKAAHGGYHGKPSKKDVNSLLGLYAATSVVATRVAATKELPGTQLKLKF